jgi:hypothetical protein
MLAKEFTAHVNVPVSYKECAGTMQCSDMMGTVYQGTNGPGLICRFGRPIRVTFRDKIESLLRGQGILSLKGGEMYQSKQARD